MNIAKIEQLGKQLYFTLDDVAAALGVGRASAMVACSRYAKSGLFVRVKNGFYLLGRTLKDLDRDDISRLANFIQVPSYVSFLTALSYHEATTQAARSVCDSACLKYSRKIDIRGNIFNFYRLKKDLYFGFEKVNGLFIATPEKAFLDGIYLMSLGKYSLDVKAIDLNKINTDKLRKTIKVFPAKTKALVSAICKI